MTTATMVGNGGEHERRRSLSGRSPTEVVRSSGLPGPLAELVLAVTGKTRLWNRERVSVARELCGHFLDGLDAGATAEELKASFGDPRRTARLITRAKKRNRPWAWRAFRKTAQTVWVLLALLVVFYGWSTVRYYSGTPTITFNVQAEMNAASLAVPLDERGWPHYRDAARRLAAAKFGETVEKIDGWPNPRPGTPEWGAACAAVDAVRPALEQVRLGASKARSACVLSSKGPAEGKLGIPDGERVDPKENPIGLGVLLPQLSVYRQHARLLAFEANRAAYEGRGADAVSAIEQMLALSRHSGEDGTLIAQLVSLAISNLTFDTLNRAVRDRPALFSEGQLVRLAHGVGAYAPNSLGGDGAWRPNLRLERRAFEDLLQRFYTDDGDGDGRLCDGLSTYASEFGVTEPMAGAFFKPVLATVVARRKETAEYYDRMMDRFESENAKPPYLRDRDGLERDIEALRAGAGVRNSLVELMVPSLTQVTSSFDVARAQRDALAAGLAVELYFRRQGRFPASWGEMVPLQLPAAPIDPWSGRALVLRAGAGAGGRPLIYSVGADKIDNGGVIGTPWSPINAATSPVFPAVSGDIPTGDWVLWPQVEPAGDASPMKGAPVSSGRGFTWGWLGSLMGR